MYGIQRTMTPVFSVCRGRRDACAGSPGSVPQALRVRPLLTSMTFAVLKLVAPQAHCATDGHAGGATRNLPYSPIACLAVGSRHTGAPSALSLAGHWLEMAVECQDSGLPAMSEPQKWRRSVTQGWQDGRKPANDFCHSAAVNAGSGGFEGMSRRGSKALQELTLRSLGHTPPTRHTYLLRSRPTSVALEHKCPTKNVRFQAGRTLKVAYFRGQGGELCPGSAVMVSDTEGPRRRCSSRSGAVGDGPHGSACRVPDHWPWEGMLRITRSGIRSRYCVCWALAQVRTVGDAYQPKTLTVRPPAKIFRPPVMPFLPASVFAKNTRASVPV
jgi:hypothetical protein